MKKMTQLCFKIILFTSINQSKSLYTYFIQYNLKFFQTEALVSKSFTPRNSSGSGSMSPFEMVTVSDTLKAQDSNFIQIHK